MDSENAARIYHAWNEALGNRDLAASMALYAPDASLESPLVRHLLGSDIGVVKGRDELRRFVELAYRHQPALRQRHRTGYFTDGRQLVWEYPRVTPSGEQIDLVEVMELRDGLIQQHRVYWGWLGVKALEENRHNRT